jgi:hypothetical protein
VKKPKELPILNVFPEVEVKGPRSYVGVPRTYMVPRSGLYARRSRTEASGSKRTPLQPSGIWLDFLLKVKIEKPRSYRFQIS